MHLSAHLIFLRKFHKALFSKHKKGSRRPAPGLLPAFFAAIATLLGPLAVAVADGPSSAGPVAVPSGRPQRIVSMTPSVTETLFALGAGPRVVGVSTYCDYPPEVTSLPRVGTFLAPVIESVIALRPDTVITSPTPGNRSPVAALERAGIRVAVVTEGSASIADARRAILETADIIGRSLEAAAIVTSIDGMIEAIRSSVAKLDRPPVALVVGHDPLVLAGPESYLGELVTVGGGENIANALGGKWPRTSLEYLLEAAPDVIIDASTDDNSRSEAEGLARRWSRYSEIPAVAAGRVHGHASHLLVRPGPRMGEAARKVASWIHPHAWD